MKYKYFLYPLIVIFSFIVILLLRNIYLFYTYEHGNNSCIKIEGTKNVLKGRWFGVFDTWEHMVDERHVFKYDFDTDTSGYFYYEYYSNKIDGEPSDVYSWRSLLPYDNKEFKSYSSKVVVDSIYIVYLSGGDSFWRDPVYSKYRLVSDSLYVDTKKYNHPYFS